jgi:hypothetical protein
MALALTANLLNPELISTVSKDVFSFLAKFNERSLSVVKKALVCLGRIVKVNKSIHDAGVFSKHILKLIDMKNFEALQA